jgi:hypothetical protein
MLPIAKGLGDRAWIFSIAVTVRRLSTFFLNWIVRFDTSSLAMASIYRVKVSIASTIFDTLAKSPRNARRCRQIGVASRPRS